MKVIDGVSGSIAGVCSMASIAARSARYSFNSRVMASSSNMLNSQVIEK